VKASRGVVLVASVLVASPVLWMVRAGTLTLTEALQRWGICLALCWLAITCVGALAFPDAHATGRPPATDEPDQLVPVPETLPRG
jgi:hypothetical protein